MRLERPRRAVGITALVAAAMVGSLIGAGAASATPAAGSVDPCTLLTRAEVAHVMTGAPDAGAPQVVPGYPPNGTGCVWTSRALGKQPRGVVGVLVQLYDLRLGDADFAARYGTSAATFVQQRCTQRAPAGSGVSLPKTKPQSGLGDTACTTKSAVDVATGPYFLVVSAGSLDQKADNRAVAVKLARRAVRRLND